MDLIKRRRLMLATEKKPRLPAEYQEVEYLRGTGTQYIYLSYYPNRNDEYTLRVKPDLWNNEHWFFGNYGGNGWSFDFHLTNAYFRSIGIRYGATNVDISEFCTVICDESNLEVNNREYDVTLSAAYRMSDNPLELFAGGTFYRSPGHGCVSMFAIRRYGEMLHQYIPCRRKSDNKPGVYDIIGNAFYTNSGSGEFLVGPDVN